MTQSSNKPMQKQRIAAMVLAMTAWVALPAAARDVQAAGMGAPASAQVDMESLMSYVLKARLMSPEQLASELRDQRSLHEAGNDAATLKLAMILADQPNVQELEVSALLQPLFEEARATKPELRAFALLISRDMQDRKRMKEALASTQNRLRDAQRSQEASEAKAAQMRRQIDDLQNKINAFMMMEQSILKRGR